MSYNNISCVGIVDTSITIASVKNPHTMCGFYNIPNMGVSSMKLALLAHTKSLIGMPASIRAMVAALIHTLRLPVGVSTIKLYQ